jgi:hypothetical protein
MMTLVVATGLLILRSRVGIQHKQELAEKKSSFLNEEFFKGTINKGVSGCHVAPDPEIKGSYPAHGENSREEKSISK